MGALTKTYQRAHMPGAEYQSVKRRYFDALNIKATFAPPVIQPVTTIPERQISDTELDSDLLFDLDELSSAPQTPIQIPSTPQMDYDSDTSITDVFIPPHLMTRGGTSGEDSFSLYEYRRKKQLCANAY